MSDMGPITYLGRLLVLLVCTLLPLMMRKAIPAWIGALADFSTFATLRDLGVRQSGPSALPRARLSNAAELRRRVKRGCVRRACLATTLRSFNARAGLLTEL